MPRQSETSSNWADSILILHVMAHSADIQDSDGAVGVLKAIGFHFSWLRHVFADGGYAGDKLLGALKLHRDWTVETIKRSNRAKGFELSPRRWVVERTLCLIWQIPPPCQRLGKIHLQCNRMGLYR